MDYFPSELVDAINFLLTYGDYRLKATVYIFARAHKNLALIYHPEAPEDLPLSVKWIEEDQKTPMPF